MFKESCPHCGAGPIEARLEVISGSFSASGMFLNKNGFCTVESNSFNTENEKVKCNNCESIFSLDECRETFIVPEAFKGRDWTELAQRFQINIYEDDCSILETYIRNNYYYNPKIVETCHEFLEALIAAGGPESVPLWEGLNKIRKSTSFFIDTFCHLLPGMWT